MPTLEERLDAIDQLRLRLTPDGDEPHGGSPHRPDFSVWASFEADEGGALVTLSMSALWAQPQRFASMAPTEARELARVLTEMADAVEREIRTDDARAEGRKTLAELSKLAVLRS